MSPDRANQILESSRRQKQKYDLLLKKFTDLQKDYNLLKNSKNKENKPQTIYRTSTATTIAPPPQHQSTKYLSPLRPTVIHHPQQQLPQGYVVPSNARLLGAPKSSLQFSHTDNSMDGSRRVIHASPSQPHVNTRIIRVSNHSNLSRSNSNSKHKIIPASPKVIIDGRPSTTLAHYQAPPTTQSGHIRRVIASPTTTTTKTITHTTPHRLSRTLIEIPPQSQVLKREGSPGQQRDLWRSSLEKSIEETKLSQQLSRSGSPAEQKNMWNESLKNSQRNIAKFNA